MKSRKSLWLVGMTILAVILSSCNLGATPAPTEDPGIIQTQAFSIVVTQAALQQTQTAMAIPPTAMPTNTPFPTPTLGELPTFTTIGGTVTPLAFNTQQPGLTPLASVVPTVGVVATFTTKNGCNDALFITESAPLDKTVLAPGKNFAKSWQLQNTGTCAWDEGYSFFYLSDLSSPELKGYSITLSKRKPEEFTPAQEGSTVYSQTWVVKLEAPDKPGEYKGYWKMKDDAGNLFGPLVSVWIIVK
jgi:hypothetical protein